VTNPKIRVVLAKIGLDGHDRGIRVVERALNDAGMQVIYAGLWQTPEQVARAVTDHDADVVGVSLLSGAHLTLIPPLVAALRVEGVENVPLVVGGIIPESDSPKLKSAGVARILGPGATGPQIVGCFKELAISA
jgi:methylmalonyl-CoA mutase cobalamin-binding domain/chain